MEADGAKLICMVVPWSFPPEIAAIVPPWAVTWITPPVVEMNPRVASSSLSEIMPFP